MCNNPSKELNKDVLGATRLHVTTVLTFEEPAVLTPAEARVEFTATTLAGMASDPRPPPTRRDFRLSSMPEMPSALIPWYRLESRVALLKKTEGKIEININTNMNMNIKIERETPGQSRSP